MPTLKNFVAVDWRSGPDRIYFFFKDTGTYTRFDIGDNKVPEGYPATVNGNWGSFDKHVKDLRFGFTTTNIDPWGGNAPVAGHDILWLFYYEGDTPMVCRYDQNLDEVNKTLRVKDSVWQLILPYFDRIVAGTWWQVFGRPKLFKFLMDDGHYLFVDLLAKQKVFRKQITQESWRGLDNYKHRIITAAQNDHPLFDKYYYIFLTNNEYIKYDITNNRVATGPRKIDDGSWPGLLRD
ncbi:hypothetical protein [Pseudomonas sp. ANT_H12B]|uniref:hypothetical protein n=1 Tax=Pseudomonas sp. ANT_H12B TaxID=2597348 RepID=UPI0011EC99B9|nr:hypothetical protein [Pseudomonas sp. ANT_H12B]KAA0974495.1 hypothetical protein FQ185_11220 [Pseudomonas sp. ANT_H12B]